MAKRNAVDEIAKQAAREAVSLSQRQGNDPMPETEDALDPSSGATDEDVPAILDFDLFAFCSERVAKLGDEIEYTVKKDGAQVGTLQHPTTWDELHKRYGPGAYRIIARSGALKRFIKSESRRLGPLPEMTEEEEAEEQAEAMRQPGAQNPMFEALTFLQTINKDSESKAREAAQAATNAGNQTMTLIMQMMQSQATQSQTMVLEIAKMQSENARAQAENMRAMMQELKASIPPPPPVEKGMSSFDLIKMLQDSETKGFDRCKMIMEMADEKADEKAEMIAEMKAESGGGEKEDLTTTLIKTMLPTIASSFMAQQQAAAAQPVLAHPQAQLPPPPAPVRRAVRPAGPGSPRPPAQAQRQAAPGGKAPSSGGHSPSGGNGAPGGAQGLGLPRSGSPAPASRPQDPAPVVPKPSVKERILEIAVPIIGEGLAKSMEAPDKADEIAKTTAEAVLGALKAKGASRELVLSNFKREDILELAKENGLPDAVNPWLLEFYAHLETSTGVGSGEPPTSEQKGNP